MYIRTEENNGKKNTNTTEKFGLFQPNTSILLLLTIINKIALTGL